MKSKSKSEHNSSLKWVARLRIALALGVIAAYALVAPTWAQQLDLRAIFEAAPDTPPIPPQPGLRGGVAEDEKLDPTLRELVGEAQERGLRGLELEGQARRLGVSLQDGQVAVRIYVASASAKEPIQRIVEAAGGALTVTDASELTLLARVPTTALVELARSSFVHYIGIQETLEPFGVLQHGIKFGRSEGIAFTLANLLHRQGVTGKGVKIGILDFGFSGYAQLQAVGALPKPVEYREFNTQMENGDRHGTACAGIVHQIAPGAALYLAAAKGPAGEFLNAAKWLLEKNVDIINFSGGGAEGPGNGRNEFGQLIDATSDTTVWVVAAGNAAQRHWSGWTVDENKNGWVDIGSASRPKALLILRPQQKQLRVLVRWDDWGSEPARPRATQDIDAYVFRYVGGRFEYQTHTRAPQRGVGEPVERISISASPDAIYAVGLRAVNITRKVRVHVFVRDDVDMYPTVADGSVLNPATAQRALAVGAVGVHGGDLDPDSSQGPTDDGRIKPEVGAPTGVTTVYGSRFLGTSAAAPHVAGFAALLKQIGPKSRGAELWKEVIHAVQPRGRPLPNNQYGHGTIKATQLPRTYNVRAKDTDGHVKLPLEWGGDLSWSVVDQLLRNGLVYTKGPAVTLAAGSDQYRVGDGMMIGLHSSQDTHCVFLERDLVEHYRLLPVPEAVGLRLLTQGRYYLPRDGSSITVSTPTGWKDALALCTPRPTSLGATKSEERPVSASMVRYKVQQ